MAKKEDVKITYESINLLTAMNYGSIADISGFYGKEVFFTDGFEGNVSLLFQALGNIGAFARNTELDKDISIIIIGEKLLSNLEDGEIYPFFIKFEELLNKNNSPYRRMKVIRENQLILYLKNRAKGFDDEQLKILLTKYKSDKADLFD